MITDQLSLFGSTGGSKARNGHPAFTPERVLAALDRIGFRLLEPLPDKLSGQTVLRVSCPEGHPKDKWVQQIVRGDGCWRCYAGEPPTEGDVVAACQRYGFQLVDAPPPPLMKKTHVTLSCRDGHLFKRIVQDITKYDCLECVNGERYTLEEVRRLIEQAGHTVITAPERVHSRAYFVVKCPQGHTNKRAAHTIRRKPDACRKCSIGDGYTRHEVSEMLAIANLSLADPTSTPDRLVTSDRVEAVCESGHITTKTVGNLPHTGCRHCAQHGFSGAKPATLYIMRHDRFMAWQFGITNSSRRILKHQQHGWKTVKTYHSDNGYMIEKAERELKRWKKDNGYPHACTKEDMPQYGWTETLRMIEVPSPYEIFAVVEAAIVEQAGIPMTKEVP